MLDEKLQAYIEGLLPERNGLFAEMEAFARGNHVPIMEPAGMEALLQVLRILKPLRILELGTAIGYSAMRMAEAIPEATVVTIERDEERYRLAKEYFSRGGFENKIHPILGDALEVSDKVSTFAPFDALFIDAAKGQYQKFFSLYEPYLTAGGVLVTDNVLFKGLVYNEQTENKRLAKLAEKIHGYNVWLAAQEAYTTTILPIGDGVAISYKRG
ncbi:SAM-dependent methyltransferase [Bacillus sp. FJAT-27225]|uniref:O-methyltransferase n=1 Tax=Bacillus sp. FJAT-27225 TaxID=1743144 RepID=UPI00080C2FC5|nr:O-methyltransferase [Bacillus sp. FJAT-27225]OCA91202.1 SAM-dependent methyltransferase [Bacillus sp. FJAT-27225]